LEVSVGSVNSKGQVTIPKEIRDALGLVEGDRIVFILEKERVVIRKATGEKLSDLLTRQEPWPEPGLEFQRRLREEWRSPRS
jgi:antitoxin PrlF